MSNIRLRLISKTVKWSTKQMMIMTLYDTRNLTIQPMRMKMTTKHMVIMKSNKRQRTIHARRKLNIKTCSWSSEYVEKSSRPYWIRTKNLSHQKLYIFTHKAHPTLACILIVVLTTYRCKLLSFFFYLYIV